MKHIGRQQINIKKNFRKIKLTHYKNAREMADDLNLSESYIYDVISLKTDKVPTITTIEYVANVLKVPFNSFFEDVDIETIEKDLKEKKKIEELERKNKKKSK